MDPLLHEERVFVCFFQGKWRVSCPPGRERERLKGGRLELPNHLWPPSAMTNKRPGSEGKLPCGPRTPGSEEVRETIMSQRRGVSMSELSLTQTQAHRKPRILRLPWAVIIWDGSLLSGPTALIYISITWNRWRKESSTSASIIFITN